jgi:SAM-dependent methyltransferase
MNIFWPKSWSSVMLNCPVCERSSVSFNPLPAFFIDEAERHGFQHPLDQWEMINYKNYECPNCGASDRERLFALFLRIISRESQGRKFRLLDFAPSRIFQLFVNSLRCFEYRTADLLVNGFDDKIDIENMYQYPDNYFDCLICSHVLEHVKNDKKALSELYRVLRSSGFGIIQTPISLFHQTTYEDFSKTTVAERWQHFGQGDHVRIYSRKDYINKIKCAGFELKEFGVNFFGEDLFMDCAITNSSILYIGEKPEL